MAILTPIPPSIPWYIRVFYGIPVLGWIARDLAFGSRDHIYYALVLLLSCWTMAIMSFGLVAVYLPMVFAVPVCFLVLILLTVGK
ncbi:MAG: hypothetical protein AAF729_08680 [Pseudomonadota bacterium]